MENIRKEVGQASVQRSPEIRVQSTGGGYTESGFQREDLLHVRVFQG